MILTHDPFQPTPDSPNWDPTALGEKVNRNPRHFADMVACLDKLVGRVVNRLDELKLRSNTLVLFIGDNGTSRQITSQFRGAPFRGGKGQPTAAGTHVPFIANWPGQIPPGRVCKDLIDSTDFLPTLCDAAKVTIPTDLQLDGRSFLPQLLGRKGQPRDWTYCWYARDGGPTANHEFAATRTFKLYRKGRFFDLSSDPLEERALAVDELKGMRAEAAQRLQDVLERFADARPAHLRKAVRK
jgi:arylsulfatase A